MHQKYVPSSLGQRTRLIQRDRLDLRYPNSTKNLDVESSTLPRLMQVEGPAASMEIVDVLPSAVLTPLLEKPCALFCCTPDVMRMSSIMGGSGCSNLQREERRGLPQDVFNFLHKKLLVIAVFPVG